MSGPTTTIGFNYLNKVCTLDGHDHEEQHTRALTNTYKPKKPHHLKGPMGIRQAKFLN